MGRTETHRSEVKKPAKRKATSEGELLEQELDRCWPVWRDEPVPFPVEES